jgi:hypothetical protein
MINSFAGNLQEIMKKLAKVLPPDEMPEPPDGTEYTIEMFQDGDAESKINTVVLEEEVMNSKEGEEVLKYADVDKCFLCYNLVKPINEIKAENPCCMKLALGGRETEICSD